MKNTLRIGLLTLGVFFLFNGNCGGDDGEASDTKTALCKAFKKYDIPSMKVLSDSEYLKLCLPNLNRMAISDACTNQELQSITTFLTNGTTVTTVLAEAKSKVAAKCYTAMTDIFRLMNS